MISSRKIKWMLFKARMKENALAIYIIAFLTFILIVSLIYYNGADNPVEDFAEGMLEEELNLPRGSIRIGNETEKN